MLIQHKIVAAALVAATVCPAPVGASPIARPPVGQQQRDDDCGAAILAMAMQAAGHRIEERDLLRHRDAIGDNPEGGLSARDLVRMTAASGTGLTLAGQMIRADRFATFVAQSPVIVLIEERGEKAGFGHFVMIEGYSPERGYLVVDPAIGKRGFMAADKLMPMLRTDASSGVPRVLILHLQRGGQAAVASTPLTAEEERDYPLLDTLRRGYRALPNGKTFVTLTAGRGRQQFNNGISRGVSLSTSGSFGQISVRRGIGNGGEFGLSFGGGTTSGAVRFGDEGTVPLGKNGGVGPLTLSANRTFDIGRNGEWTGSWGGGLSLKSGYKPQGVSASIGLGRTFKRVSAFGSLDAQFVRASGHSHAAISPSFGVGIDLGKGFQTSVGIAGSMPISGEQSTGDLGFQIGKQIGRNWAVEGQFSTTVVGPRGYRAKQFGLALTFALPNRMKLM